MWGIGYLGDGRVEKINGRLRPPRDLQWQKVTATSELERQVLHPWEASAFHFAGIQSR